MDEISYSALIKSLNVISIPESFEKAYTKWNYEGLIVTQDQMADILSRYNLETKKLNTLQSYLQSVTQNNLCEYYVKFLCWVLCEQRYEYSIDSNTDFNVKNLGDSGKALNFIICLSCMIYSEKDLIRRNIPKDLYKEIPHRMLSLQMKSYKETGELTIFDLPWSMNFYTHSIYLFDRFLFVPCRYDDVYEFYRCNDEVTAIVKGNLEVDDMGQLINEEDEDLSEETNGKENMIETLPKEKKNGHFYGRFGKDRKKAFISFYDEDTTQVKGNRLSPCGFITKDIITLDKKNWKKILRKNDWMIGFHIPEGEGYTKEHVRISMKLALNFFRKYYPEIPFKGFWSASWLYDGRLSLFLKKENRIVEVQRQFFNYSGGWNGEMAYIELYGGIDICLENAKKDTSLQRNVADFLEKGGKLCETGMVYFPEELEKSYDNMIYIKNSDLEEQQRLFEKNGWRKCL